MFNKYVNLQQVIFFFVSAYIEKVIHFLIIARRNE